MKNVFSSPNSAEIGLAQNRLDAAGIACEVRNDAISQAMPGPFTSELWVLRDEDYEDARQLIMSAREFNDPSKKIQGQAQQSEGDQPAQIELVTSDPQTFAKTLRGLAAHQTQLARAMARVEQLQDVTSKLSWQVSLLKRWRTANTRMIEMLESTLDESIASFSHFDEIGVEQLKALKFAKEYRAKVPGTTDPPDKVAAVARALARVKENHD